MPTQQEIAALQAEVAKRLKSGALTTNQVASALPKPIVTPTTPVSNVINYNPNTGKQLGQGESVVSAETGKTVTQGTQFSPIGTTNASTLGVGSTPNTSNITPKVETTTPATSTKYYEDLLAKLAKEKADLETSQKANLGTTSTGQAGLIEAINNQPVVNSEQKRKDEEALAGISALEDSLNQGLSDANAIKAELQTIEDSRLAETEAARTRLTSMENISTDINDINYRYDLQKVKKTALLNTKLMELDVINGKVTNAQNKVNQIVADYTADKKAEVDKYDKLYTVYSNWISELNDEEKTILDNAHKESINALETAKANTENVLNMMIKYPGAGIVVSDTPEQAAVKASKYEDENPTINTETIGSAETGYKLINSDTGEVIKVISSGTGTGVEPSFTGDTIYDEDLLVELQGGASPIQAANIIISATGEKFTEKEKASILNRAKIIEQAIPKVEQTQQPAQEIKPAEQKALESGTGIGTSIKNFFTPYYPYNSYAEKDAANAKVVEQNNKNLNSFIGGIYNSLFK